MTTSSGIAVLLLAMTVDCLRLTDSLTSRTTRDETAAERPDSRHQLQQQQLHQPPQYFRQCPSVVCPPVSNECETVEFLVYAFEYRLPSGTSDDRRGTTVSVRCESCGYCLDSPSTRPRRTSRSRSRSRSSHRRRRLAITKTSLGQQCRPVESCPNVSAQCRDVRPTRVLFADTTCREPCPACYDTVPIPDEAYVTSNFV